MNGGTSIFTAKSMAQVRIAGRRATKASERPQSGPIAGYKGFDLIASGPPENYLIPDRRM